MKEAAAVICGKCARPIERGETGVRHFGFFTAHSENRCLELLLAEVERRKDWVCPETYMLTLEAVKVETARWARGPVGLLVSTATETNMCDSGICPGCRADQRRKKHGDYVGVVEIARNGVDRVNKLEKELQAASKGAERNAKIARSLADENAKLRAEVQMLRATVVDSARDVIDWCDKNPPAGDALYCIARLRHALATASANA